MDIESLISALQSRARERGIELTEDGARELAQTCLGAVHHVLASAGMPLQLADSDTNMNMLVSEDLRSGLGAWSGIAAKKRRVFVIPSAGDGSCFFTAARTGIDLVYSTRYALQALGDGKTEVELEKRPYLDGSLGGPNHSENFALRKKLVFWYVMPPSNLDIETGETISFCTNQAQVTAAEQDFKAALAAWQVTVSLNPETERPTPSVLPVYGEVRLE